jgi:mannose-6-phosphate isomerase-like protein (cupin superfamily)/uncharacterized protein YndB with AHSA1/START domain
MIEPGAVLDMRAMGARVEIRRSDADAVEFDVIGRPFGLVAQPHVHSHQQEHYEVISGSMRLVVDGHEQILRAGDTASTPAGVPHTQAPGDGEGTVRIRLTPGGDGEAFLRRLAELCTTGQMNRWGFPKPLAAAQLTLDFADSGHAAKPPLGVQLALSRAIVRLASREYLFVDEWDVAAPREAVFEALADAHSYPEWWKPVYIAVESEGEPEVGKVSRQHFKGRLPYHLHTTSTITRLEAPEVIEANVAGDLAGHGKWTLTETAAGTHVRFDWEVTADRRLLRMLSPVLRPALRWNHAWAIARAQEGLEPYAQRLAARAGVAA